MDEETLSFHRWELEKEETERVKVALERADSGHLVEHSRLKEMAAVWCKIEQSKLNEVAVGGGKDARISWSDAAVTDLQHMCEHMAQVWEADGLATAESYLKQVFSTIELIASYPDVGRPGLVQGTREWGMGFGILTIAYRCLPGEIQVLGVLVSPRKWPHMKSASGWWGDMKTLS